MPELVIDPVTSAGDLRRALSPGAADEHGELDGDRLTVPDDEDAEMLVDTYPNVRWASERTARETDTDTDPEPPRAELDSDGVTYTDEADDGADDWDADEWLDGNYQDRADMVRTGAVDNSLDEIESCETSETVLEAVDARRDELED